MTDRIPTNRTNNPDDYTAYEESSSKESTENPSTPRMIQKNTESSKSSISTYPHSTSNIKDDVKKILKKHAN
jgi:hypothetical protein